jgi:PadR family transcriptional regulator
MPRLPPHVEPPEIRRCNHANTAEETYRHLTELAIEGDGRVVDYNVVTVADILGSFEQAVLLAIVRLESGAYGRAILKEVQVRLERDVAAGAVQATLERLERKGLVRSRLGSGTPVRDGRARRFYTVLSEGLRALNDARKTHESVWRGFARPLKART